MSKSAIPQIAHTERFVLTVDLELRRKDELERLIDIGSLIDDSNYISDSYNSEEIDHLLRPYMRQLELLAPPFQCPYQCHRQLLFDSSNHYQPLQSMHSQPVSQTSSIALKQSAITTNQATPGSLSTSSQQASTNGNNSNCVVSNVLTANELNYHTNYNKRLSPKANESGSGKQQNYNYNHSSGSGQQFKFRDATSSNKSTDVVLLLFTDLLLICKQVPVSKGSHQAGVVNNLSQEQQQARGPDSASGTSPRKDGARGPQSSSIASWSSTRTRADSASHQRPRGSLLDPNQMPKNLDQPASGPIELSASRAFSCILAPSDFQFGPDQQQQLKQPQPQHQHHQKQRSTNSRLTSTSVNVGTGSILSASLHSSVSSLFGRYEAGSWAHRGVGWVKRSVSDQPPQPLPLAHSAEVEARRQHSRGAPVSVAPPEAAVSTTRSSSGGGSVHGGGASLMSSAMQSYLINSQLILANSRQTGCVGAKGAGQNLKLRLLKSPYQVQRISMVELKDSKSVLLLQLADDGSLLSSSIIHLPASFGATTHLATSAPSSGSSSVETGTSHTQSWDNQMTTNSKERPHHSTGALNASGGCTPAPKRKPYLASHHSPAAQLIGLLKEAQLKLKIMEQFHAQQQTITKNNNELARVRCCSSASQLCSQSQRTFSTSMSAGSEANSSLDPEFFLLDHNQHHQHHHFLAGQPQASDSINNNNNNNTTRTNNNNNNNHDNNDNNNSNTYSNNDNNFNGDLNNKPIPGRQGKRLSLSRSLYGRQRHSFRQQRASLSRLRSTRNGYSDTRTSGSIIITNQLPNETPFNDLNNLSNNNMDESSRGATQPTNRLMSLQATGVANNNQQQRIFTLETLKNYPTPKNNLINLNNITSNEAPSLIHQPEKLCGDQTASHWRPSSQWSLGLQRSLIELYRIMILSHGQMDKLLWNDKFCLDSVERLLRNRPSLVGAANSIDTQLEIIQNQAPLGSNLQGPIGRATNASPATMAHHNHQQQHEQRAWSLTCGDSSNHHAPRVSSLPRRGVAATGLSRAFYAPFGARMQTNNNNYCASFRLHYSGKPTFRHSLNQDQRRASRASRVVVPGKHAMSSPSSLEEPPQLVCPNPELEFPNETSSTPRSQLQSNQLMSCVHLSNSTSHLEPQLETLSSEASSNCLAAVPVAGGAGTGSTDGGVHSHAGNRRPRVCSLRRQNVVFTQSTCPEVDLNELERVNLQPVTTSHEAPCHQIPISTGNHSLALAHEGEAEMLRFFETTSGKDSAPLSLSILEKQPVREGAKEALQRDIPDHGTNLSETRNTSIEVGGENFNTRLDTLSDGGIAVSVTLTEPQSTQSCDFDGTTNEQGELVEIITSDYEQVQETIRTTRDMVETSLNSGNSSFSKSTNTTTSISTSTSPISQPNINSHVIYLSIPQGGLKYHGPESDNDRNSIEITKLK